MPIYGRFSAPYILHFLLYIIKEFCLVGTCRKAQLVCYLFGYFILAMAVGNHEEFCNVSVSDSH